MPPSAFLQLSACCLPAWYGHPRALPTSCCMPPHPRARLQKSGWLRMQATVGAGLPIISTLQTLLETGDDVQQIEGVFSGTLSYIFNRSRRRLISLLRTVACTAWLLCPLIAASLLHTAGARQVQVIITLD